MISATLISAGEDRGRQGKRPWEDSAEMWHLKGGKATEEVNRGIFSPKQRPDIPIKSHRVRDPANTLILKVLNSTELCGSRRLRIAGTRSASSRGLVRSYYRGPPPLRRFSRPPGAGGSRRPPARAAATCPRCPLPSASPGECGRPSSEGFLGGVAGGAGWDGGAGVMVAWL